MPKVRYCSTKGAIILKPNPHFIINKVIGDFVCPMVVAAEIPTLEVEIALGSYGVF